MDIYEFILSHTILAERGDLMQRMGHDSVRAALIYQHPTREADQRIADAMNAKITEARQQRV